MKLNFSKVISCKFKKLKNNNFKAHSIKYQNISINHKVISKKEMIEFKDMTRRTCVKFTKFKQKDIDNN